MDVKEREVRVAGSLRHEAKVKAVAALGLVSVHHTDGLDELRAGAGRE